MRRAAWTLLVAALVTSGGRAAGPSTPVIVELFTSEGCSDCPPADTLLEKLIATPAGCRRRDHRPRRARRLLGSARAGRIGSRPRRSPNRQQVYGARFGTESIYTPQMVVDGRAEFVGSDASAAREGDRDALAPRRTAIVAHRRRGAPTPGTRRRRDRARSADVSPRRSRRHRRRDHRGATCAPRSSAARITAAP